MTQFQWKVVQSIFLVQYISETTTGGRQSREGGNGYVSMQIGFKEVIKISQTCYFLNLSFSFFFFFNVFCKATEKSWHSVYGWVITMQHNLHHDQYEGNFEYHGKTAKPSITITITVLAFMHFGWSDTKALFRLFWCTTTQVKSKCLQKSSFFVALEIITYSFTGSFRVLLLKVCFNQNTQSQKLAKFTWFYDCLL